MTNILVYGFYLHGNLGDELFKEVFIKLFPKFNFKFTDIITAEDLHDVSAVFFGGGSFLFAEPLIKEDALTLLKSKSIFYIGVGAETDIHPIHKDLMKQAKLIALRSWEKYSDIKKYLNPNTVVIADIVYALQKSVVKNTKNDKLVVIAPTMETIPQHFDPHWKHVAWNYFLSEFPQFLDHIVDDGYDLKFVSMYNNQTITDKWAASELIIRMKHRSTSFIVDEAFNSVEGITSLLSQASLVITQRYHGMILAQMARVPYITLYHHDKLKFHTPSEGLNISYYGIFKRQLVDDFYQTINTKITPVLPIELDIFDRLRQLVLEAMGGERCPDMPA